MDKYNKENNTIKPRSVKLTTDEKKAFKAWIKKQDSFSAAARTLSMTRQTFYSLKDKGNGSLESVEKIRQVISAEQ